MLCPCGNAQCYVCSESIRGYEHFDQGGGPATNVNGKKLCPLSDNVNDRHEREVREAEQNARQQALTENPGLSNDELEIKMSDAVNARNARPRADFAWLAGRAGMRQMDDLFVAGLHRHMEAHDARMAALQQDGLPRGWLFDDRVRDYLDGARPDHGDLNDAAAGRQFLMLHDFANMRPRPFAAGAGAGAAGAAGAAHAAAAQAAVPDNQGPRFAPVDPWQDWGRARRGGARPMAPPPVPANAMPQHDDLLPYGDLIDLMERPAAPLQQLAQQQRPQAQAQAQQIQVPRYEPRADYADRRVFIIKDHNYQPRPAAPVAAPAAPQPQAPHQHQPQQQYHYQPPRPPPGDNQIPGADRYNEHPAPWNPPDRGPWYGGERLAPREELELPPRDRRTAAPRIRFPEPREQQQHHARRDHHHRPHEHDRPYRFDRLHRYDHAHEQRYRPHERTRSPRRSPLERRRTVGG